MKQLNYLHKEVPFNDAKLFEDYLQALLDEKIENVEELLQWMSKLSELDDLLSEKFNRDYVALQCHNDDKEAEQTYQYNQEVLVPIVKKYEALYDRAFYENPHRQELDPNQFGLYIKRKMNAIDLFREENIPLEVKEESLNVEYFKITGGMTVTWEGEEKTLPQMSIYLKSSDRDTRNRAWQMIMAKKMEAKDQLHRIMDELIALRVEIAKNSGFNNYRDYMFKKYERFDYLPEECYEFHSSVQNHVVPLLKEIQKKHQAQLGLDDYRPWDTAAVVDGMKPLKPYESSETMVEDTIKILNNLDPEFATMLSAMRESGTLDLDSRKAKSPGGFCINYPLTERSFIFMNSTGQHGDFTTLVHEAGHCVHNLKKSKLPFSIYRATPMESSELASMSLELLTMDQWHIPYADENDLKRAKREQLEDIVKLLAWVMVIDKFQHWLYLNPDHSHQDRDNMFKEIFLSFEGNVDWSGLDEELCTRWKSQLHIFEVPFYYIEYAIAQLGAVQMWKQYKQDPQRAMANYKKALALGSSKPLPEVYEAAGITFDFKDQTIKEIMSFITDELHALQ